MEWNGMEWNGMDRTGQDRTGHDRIASQTDRWMDGWIGRQIDR